MTSGSQVSGVCVYSFHPLVLAELERVFADNGIKPKSYRLDASRVADVRQLPIPPARAYVVEANSRKRSLQAVVGEIVSRRPEARLLVVAENFEQQDAFALLELGAKGLLKYADLHSHLIAAAREIASGSLWVPRALLSRFVDSTIALVRRQRVTRVASHLSRREREVHELLMENHSNKEIARRLHMSERTAKFHVSNLLNKHGVKRRTDLILLSFTESQPA